jgi:small-conductance mechanosensitive channel
MDVPSTPTDLWATIQAFIEYKLFEINQTPITLASILLFFVFLALFFIVSRILNRVLLRRLLTRFHIDEGIRYTIIRINHYVVMIVGTLLAFQFIGINLSGLAVILGFLSVGIGFGLQNITSNFVSGIILLFERPIRVGDRVTVGEVEGDVLAINMRATMIQSLTNISIIVPNSEFVSGRVVNWSHGDPKIRIDLEVGVSYSSDLDTVLDALQSVAAEHPKVLSVPKPDVLLTSFGDSSWNMMLRVWVGDPKGHYNVRSELNQAVVRKFREVGVEIPFPQRDLHVRSPLPLPLSQKESEAGD